MWHRTVRTTLDTKVNQFSCTSARFATWQSEVHFSKFVLQDGTVRRCCFCIFHLPRAQWWNLFYNSTELLETFLLQAESPQIYLSALRTFWGTVSYNYGLSRIYYYLLLPIVPLQGSVSCSAFHSAWLSKIWGCGTVYLQRETSDIPALSAVGTAHCCLLVAKRRNW